MSFPFYLPALGRWKFPNLWVNSHLRSIKLRFPEAREREYSQRSFSGEKYLLFHLVRLYLNYVVLIGVLVLI